ncbi:MAG: carboxypeptidase-like regulatory domain-containing protein [Tannerella sp.]|nr:carboxypeptidase-like regulatory domain-containing protein [Tannerella sp.]
MKRLLFILTLLSVLLHIQAQTTRTIRGKVTDASDGEPIVGVNIQLKGTTVGLITDIDGEYSLSFSHDNPVLQFSFIGYETQEFQIAPHVTTLNVALREDVMLLEEVVVIGYGVQKKSVVTGAVSTVRADAIKKTDKKGKTWKRSGMPENSIRLEVGDGEDDFLPLEAAQMAVQVDGFRVRVLMDCFFFNDKKDGLEGTFKLRLPTGATPYYFAFGETEYMDSETYDEDVYDKLIDDDSKKIKPYGKQIPYVKYDSENFDLSPEEIEDMDSREWDDVKEARIVSKQKAARAYEETVSASIDPALMEWAGADFFSCRVFPLSRGKLHRVVIGYDLNMTEANDFREYILSLPAEAKELRVDADIYAPVEMKPEILPAVETTQQDDRLYVSLHNPKKKEYTIHYNTVEPILLNDETNDYFAANYRISLPEIKQEQLPGDAIFLLDVSLSSQPDKFNVWLTLLEEILTQNKDVIKRFSVVCFNIETFWWNKGYQKNNYYNVSRFLEYANTLALEGATDLGSALLEASNPSWLKENKPKHLFVMSDADFNWGESSMFALKNLINQGDRIHTYKTGLSGTNVATLDYLSKETGGFSFTVTGEEEAVLTAKSFRYRPWQIEEIKVEGVNDFLISGQPSQLYNGQKLIFGGRGKPKGNIYIRVNNGIETKELNLRAGRQLESGLSKRIYGQLALSQLESFGFQTEEATESYATYFRLPNATMSFLMLESQWDYERFGIDDDDAEYFVEKNTVAAIMKELLEKEPVPLGDGKNEFFAWLERLKKDTELYFEADERFFEYINSLPDDIFMVKLIPYTYRVRFSEQQSDNEKEALENENLRYDKILPLANARKSAYGKADALKLMSSVIERNAGDFIALRDIAIKAIEWGLGDQAYYMMRRIIANRQYEAVAYLTAAEALAKSNYTEMSLIYYYICLNCDWDSDYGSFKEIAALQGLRFINDIEKSYGKNKESLSAQTMNFVSYFKTEIESYLEDKDLLIKEADIVIIINWNTNNTDVDLHVMEPTGEECYYSNSSTEIGGQLTIDVTDGYGPEMYVLREAVNGEYSVSLDYYADDDTKTSSKSKVYIDFYRNWGRANEKHIRKTIELENRKDKDKILQFKVRKKNN